MLWFVIILAILLVIIALILPANITAKLSGIAVGIGMLFTGYTLYLSTQAERRETRRRRIDRDNDYWVSVFSTFVREPSLEPMYRSIYGDLIPAKEHAMYSMMMQIIENVVTENDISGNDEDDVDDAWTDVIRRWISPKSFKLFWQETSNEFTPETQLLINSLIKEEHAENVLNATS